MKIHGIQHGSRVNGPELRSVVWTQGCSLACPGCWNPATHSFDAGTEYTPEDLARKILNECAVGTKGLTISGGEPMQQADRLLDFMREVKAYRPDWSIGLFAGYTLPELIFGDFRVMSRAYTAKYRQLLWHSIRRQLDFATVGRYDRTKPIDPASDTLLDNRADLRLVSSTNQSVELFSTRYTLADFPSLSVEYSIDANGLFQVTGFPV